ncbi:MAG: hypothetical protein ACP5QA_06380 [Phycisphaerae bacterium]
MFFWTMVLSGIVAALLVLFSAWASAQHDEDLFNVSFSLALISLFFTAIIAPSYILYKINGSVWNNINDVFLVLLVIIGFIFLLIGADEDWIFGMFSLFAVDLIVKYFIIFCVYIHSKFSHITHNTHIANAANVASTTVNSPIITFICNFVKLTEYGFITSLIVTFLALMASMADRYEGGSGPTTITGTTYNFNKNGSYNGFQTTSFNIPGNRGTYVGPGNPLTGGGLIAVFSWTMLIFYIVGFIYIYY